MKLLKCYKMWKNEFSSTRRDKWIEENSVVNTKDGICISLHTCNQILDKIIQRQGLRKISFYELRYS